MSGEEVEVEAEEIIELVRCPWCGEEVPREEYSDHLQEKHYRGEPDSRKGPYTKVE